MKDTPTHTLQTPKAQPEHPVIESLLPGPLWTPRSPGPAFVETRRRLSPTDPTQAMNLAV